MAPIRCKAVSYRLEPIQFFNGVATYERHQLERPDSLNIVFSQQFYCTKNIAALLQEAINQFLGQQITDYTRHQIEASVYEVINRGLADRCVWYKDECVPEPGMCVIYGQPEYFSERTEYENS